MQSTSIVFLLGLMDAIRDLWPCSINLEDTTIRRKHTVMFFLQLPNIPCITLWLQDSWCSTVMLILLLPDAWPCAFGLPRFTGPTNKTKLKSYWVHTFDEIMICKRNKKDNAKKREIEVLSCKGSNTNAKNFKELNSEF